jgi:hypothetical protein
MAIPCSSASSACSRSVPCRILAAKARAATNRAGGLATADVLGNEVSAG